MTWEQIQTTLVGLAASAIVGLLGKWLGMKRAEETRSAVTWAIEQGVAYAAIKLKDAKGATKQAEALTIAHSLAPKAMAKLDAEQKIVLVDATYSKMRASLPDASAFSTVGSEPLTVAKLPPPSRVPKP